MLTTLTILCFIAVCFAADGDEKPAEGDAAKACTPCERPTKPEIANRRQLTDEDRAAIKKYTEDLRVYLQCGSKCRNERIAAARAKLAEFVMTHRAKIDEAKTRWQAAVQKARSEREGELDEEKKALAQRIKDALAKLRARWADRKAAITAAVKARADEIADVREKFLTCVKDANCGDKPDKESTDAEKEARKTWIKCAHDSECGKKIFLARVQIRCENVEAFKARVIASKELCDEDKEKKLACLFADTDGLCEDRKRATTDETHVTVTGNVDNADIALAELPIESAEPVDTTEATEEPEAEEYEEPAATTGPVKGGEQSAASTLALGVAAVVAVVAAF